MAGLGARSFSATDRDYTRAEIIVTDQAEVAKAFAYFLPPNPTKQTATYVYVTLLFQHYT